MSKINQNRKCSTTGCLCRWIDVAKKATIVRDLLDLVILEHNSNNISI